MDNLALRDLIATTMLPAIYENAMLEAQQGSGLFQDDQWRLGLAFDAYQLADAMLIARGAVQIK